MIGQRYYRQTDLCIQYMAGDIPRLSRELNRAAGILMDGMEYITLPDGSLLRGTGRSARPDTEEKMLTFFVSYNMFVIRSMDQEKTMEDINVKGVVR